MADDTISIVLPDAKKAAVYTSFGRTYGNVPNPSFNPDAEVSDSNQRELPIADAATFKAHLVNHIRQTITNDEKLQASIAGASDKTSDAWGELTEVVPESIPLGGFPE